MPSPVDSHHAARLVAWRELWRILLTPVPARQHTTTDAPATEFGSSVQETSAGGEGQAHSPSPGCCETDAVIDVTRAAKQIAEKPNADTPGPEFGRPDQEVSAGRQ